MKTRKETMKRLFPVLLLAFLTFGMPRVAEAQVTVAPFLTSNPQFLDGSGSPLNSGCVFTYAAGTTTPLVTYSDSAGSTPNSNPVLLNSGGFPQAGGIWLTAAAYKFVVKTTGGSNCSTGSTITTTDGITWATPLSTFNGITSTANVVINPGTAATSGANQSSPTLCIQGFYFNVTSLTDQWCLSDVLGTGSSPASTFTVVHSGSGGASTILFPGNVSVGGALGGQSVNGIVNAGSYATFALALAACPNPGTLSITTAITVSANATVPSTCSLEFLKPGVLNIATATTVTINSAVMAPEDAQIFSLTGTGAVAGLTLTRPEWFGGNTSAATQAAYNSLSSNNGGKIDCRALGAATESCDFSWSGTHATEITKTNVEISGHGIADYNSQTAPTGYTGGGTVVKGPIWVMSDQTGTPANGFSVHDLSVDNINGTTGADGIFINNNFNSGSSVGPPFIEGVRIYNVRTLGHATSSAFHSILCDHCDGAVVENVETFFNIYGVVMKGRRSKINGVYSRGHSGAGMYVKSDSIFGIAQDTNISNVNLQQAASAGDTAGLLIDSQATQIAQATKVSNFSARGTIYGISLQGTNTFTADTVISNFVIDSTTTAGIISGGVNGNSRVTIANGVINSPASGDGITANGQDVLIDNVMITNVGAGNGITTTGARVKVSNTQVVTTSGWGLQATGGSLCVTNLTGSANTSGLLASTNLVACTDGPRADLKTGRLVSIGSIPSCSVTGAGASATCTVGTGSTDSFGLIAISAAGAGPAATGTLTLTLTSALNTHSTSCLMAPSNTGSAAWSARATFFQNNVSTTAPVMTWDNNAVALVAASSYQLNYTCFGL